MASSGAELTITGVEDVVANLKRMGINTVKEVVKISNITALELENYSQQVAPWHDRTGIARQSIYAFTDFGATDIKIYHGIRVDYGKYLELSNGGKYRVIKPSVDKYRTIWLGYLKGAITL